MTQQERTKEIILQLKQVRIEKGLSLQNVQDLVIESGGFTSLSSIKRVFAEGCENQNFRYQDTLQPIVRALLGVMEETSEPPTAAQTDALKNVMLLKDTIISDLRRENEEIQQRHNEYVTEAKANIEKLEETHRRQLEHLMSENKRKDAIIIRRNRIIAKVSIAFGLFMLAVIVILMIDVTNPSVGWFRYAMAAIGGIL